MYFGNLIKKLLKGDISFFDVLSEREAILVINYVNSISERYEIIEHCFRQLKEKKPKYAFFLVWDIEEYREFLIEQIDSNIGLLFDRSFFHNFIGSTKWGDRYIYEHLEALVLADSELVFSILKYSVRSNDIRWIEKLLYSENYYIRGVTMYELVDGYPSLFVEYCGDIVSKMVKRDNDGKIVKIIPEELSSRIAYTMIDKGIDRKLFNKVKEFIFNNYETNILASLLGGWHAEPGLDGVAYIDVLESDMTRFFMTSRDFKYELYKIGKNIIDEKVYNTFKSKIETFVEIDEMMVEHIFAVGLGNKFLEFIEKYMELSTGTKVIRDLGHGSCTRTIRIGDYVIKCSEKKWDMDDVIPQMFLFAKEYEFECVKDGFGYITGAIEVQKYYSRAVSVDEEDVISNFYDTIKQYGYELKDFVMGFQASPNLFHLDSYKDAVNYEMEELPDWFMEEPVVWVDMDLIHKLT